MNQSRPDKTCHVSSIETEKSTVTYTQPPIHDPQTATEPAAYSCFQALLEQSKMQYPTSKTLIHQGRFISFKTEFFHLDPEKSLTFVATKDQPGHILRNELKQSPKERYWDVSTKKPEILQGEVYLYHSPTISNYTWLQIHSDFPFNAPLLRLVVLHTKDKKRNHICAVIMEDSTIEAERKWYDLGVRPERFFPFQVSVANNIMQVWIDGIEKLSKNVTYWQGLKGYYKAGVYITKKEEVGSVTVQFKSLNYAQPETEALVN